MLILSAFLAMELINFKKQRKNVQVFMPGAVFSGSSFFLRKFEYATGDISAKRKYVTVAIS